MYPARRRREEPLRRGGTHDAANGGCDNHPEPPIDIEGIDPLPVCALVADQVYIPIYSSLPMTGEP